jgi:hypothetical protein
MRRPQPAWPTALAGALEHVAISSVLTLLEMERRTGMLEVRSGSRVGRLAMREGCIVRAMLDHGLMPGCEAVCEILSWREGRFAFRVGDVRAADSDAVSPTMLLLEAARRADETPVA